MTVGYNLICFNNLCTEREYDVKFNVLYFNNYRV